MARFPFVGSTPFSEAAAVEIERVTVLNWGGFLVSCARFLSADNRSLDGGTFGQLLRIWA
jgi:hypothetical protein